MIRIVLGIILLIFAIALLATAYSITSIEVRYNSSEWASAGDAWATFTPDEDMEDARLYYKLDGFYGSHKNYIESRSYSQLRGDSFSDTSDCSPITRNNDISSTLTNYDGTTIDQDDKACPCGLAAKHYFQDSFVITGGDATLKTTGISLSVDKDSRFGNTDKTSKQWLNMEDESFMVWMQMELFPTFK